MDSRIQIGEAKKIAKTNNGNIPFSPAVNMSSCGNRFAIAVNIHAINIQNKLAITALNTNIQPEILEVF